MDTPTVRSTRDVRTAPDPFDAADELVNLCPHEICLILEETEHVIPSTGVARCAEVRDVIRDMRLAGGEVPLVHTEYGEVKGLPEPTAGKLFIVSHLVAQQCPHRLDLVVPDRLVRNHDGVVIAARALARV
ncbi:MAG: hypothetical protein GY812_12170 [Actinomycetia bacterium]|nr:hypothetical protein [Actinomycetes bacterium]